MSKKKQITQALNVERLEGESEAQTIVRYALMPEMQSAWTIQNATKSSFHGEPIDINALLNELNNLAEQINKGDLSRAKTMLSAQAHTLDKLFNNLTMRAINNMGGNFDAVDTYLKLALKAQTQCRNTWEAVSAIQNPPLANYARQVNVAQNQQINNTRAEEIKISPTQLAEEDHELLPDQRNS